MEETPVQDAAGEARPAPFGPVRPRERIVTLDVLRGFALFGILFVNVTATTQPADWFGVRWHEIGALDTAIEVLKLFFVQGKFYTLFAFLFGIGFAIQLERAEHRGQRFAWRFAWRMVLLFGIGLFHVLFIWDGDILNTYAVGGLILLLFYGVKRLLDRLARRLTGGPRQGIGRRWALAGVVVLVFGPLLLFAGFLTYAFDVRAAALAGEELTEFQQGVWRQIQSVEDPVRVAQREERRAETTATFAHGDFSDTLAHRILHLPQRIISGPFWLIVAGIFMLGAYFGRQDFIGRAAELRDGFRRLLVVSSLVGAPLSAVFVYVSMTAPELEALAWSSWINFTTKTASGLAFALAYVALITLLMLTAARRWLEPLAPVGRMALSNYLLQSVVGTVVFYGFGLGLMGELGSFEQVLYIVVLFGTQMACSRWWLTRYRFGPVEWLWRSLTYLRWQPMRVVEPPTRATRPSPGASSHAGA